MEASGGSTTSSSQSAHKLKYYIRSIDINMNLTLTLEYLRDTIRNLLGIQKVDRYEDLQEGSQEQDGRGYQSEFKGRFYGGWEGRD